MDYNFNEIEKKWQKYWDENKTFYTDVWDFSKPKFYALDMFPYPSGQGLHVGHPEGYTATDILSRMKRMQGYNVLHPMGWDAFGLPAEQYAIKTGNHPAEFTKKNIETFKTQLKMLGLSFDWDKEISTCDPSYYKWTQWIFKQLYKDGLAKLVEMPVNWCEGLGCVLSNDEVINGRSERGDFPVVRKNMKQWVLDIPKYADILLDGLEDLDWPESTKEIQRNWIGKSEGAEVTFKVDGSDDLEFTVFTTRPDTLFGATYCVLAPELDLVNKITTEDKKQEVEDYKKLAASKSDLERTELNKDKTGVFTGSYAINPVNGKKIIVKYVGQTGTNQGIKETSDAIIENTERGINELPFKSDQHAIIGIDSDKDGIVAINELTGEKQQITAPFLAGNMGFLIGGRGKTPIIAMFTSANKVAGKIKENLHKELVDILTGFQNKKYTFEEVRDKLSLLFNSANTKFPSIFYGYDVISSNNQIILSIGHNTSKFNVIIHKFKAGNSNELGTGICGSCGLVLWERIILIGAIASLKEAPVRASNSACIISNSGYRK